MSNLFRDHASGEMRSILPDAELVEFSWLHRDSISMHAVEAAPDCLKRCGAVGVDGPGPVPGRYLAEPEPYLRCNGAYSSSVMLRADELAGLIEWMDTFLTDLGEGLYGGHWRKARSAYSMHCYRFVDYTPSEIERITRRERIWATLEPHLNREDY